MFRRSFIAIAAVAAAGTKWLMAQISRGQQIQMLAEQLKATPHKADEIMSLETADLLSILESDGSGVFEKAKACQRLARVGDDSAVPALASLLADENLSHYARTALEPMPGAEPDRAFRKALGELEGAPLVGVINSVGWRRDPNALSQLAELRSSSDRDVSAAATAAISRLRRP